jgi:hypothetical protein
MEERRRVGRASIDPGSQTARMGKGGVFGVTNLETDRLIGHMIDISTEGLQMTTWKFLASKAIYNFRLKLPEPINGSVFVVFDAESTWCKDGGDAHSFVAGFKICGMTPSNAQRLKELLVSLGKPVLEPQL